MPDTTPTPEDLPAADPPSATGDTAEGAREAAASPGEVSAAAERNVPTDATTTDPASDMGDDAVAATSAADSPLASPLVPAEASPVAADAEDATAPGAGPATEGEVAVAAVTALGEAPVAAATAPAVVELSPAACAARLAELFPALFGRKGPPVPLKLRIQADIQQRAPGIFSRRTLSAYLHRLTTSTAYLVALTQAPHRLDLDGEPAGEPAEEHRQAAAVELARRREIVEARRAAEQAARRAAYQATREGVQRAPRGAQDGAQPLERGTREGAPRPERRERPARPAGGANTAGAGPRGRTGEVRRGPEARRATTRHHEPEGVARQPGTSPVNASAPHQAHALPQAAATAGPRPQVDDPQRQARAALLRAYETTTLTRANFIALKGMTDAALDALLAVARQEAADRPQPARSPRPQEAPANARPPQKQSGSPPARRGTGGAKPMR